MRVIKYYTFCTTVPRCDPIFWRRFLFVFENYQEHRIDLPLKVILKKENLAKSMNVVLVQSTFFTQKSRRKKKKFIAKNRLIVST